MQTASRQHSNNVYQQTRKIAIVAIILFALSGLISGFAVGAFVHPKAQTGSGTGTSSNTGSKSTPNTQVTHSPVTTLQPIRMGDPVVTEISTFQKANASTPYIFTAHAVDTSIDKHHGKQIYASGITCKLWLQHLPQGNFVDLSIDRLRKMDIQEPLTGDEIPGALIFAPGVSQIQTTNSNGQVSWNYTVATSVEPGNYYLVVLMDWQGKYSNWSWRYVVISK
ncbi:MAG: hypothetical protein ACXWPS_03345 [Ktedonobacteraceae bacterium]